MHRILIAAASAAFLAASVAPAFADDYPPCAGHDQDHCRVVEHHVVVRHHHHVAVVHHHHHHHDDTK